MRAEVSDRWKLSPAAGRRGLHALHTLSGLALLGTGLLIQWPELRARVLGGYGRELGLLHDQAAIAFLAAPALAVALSGSALVREASARLRRPHLT